MKKIINYLLAVAIIVYVAFIFLSDHSSRIYYKHIDEETIDLYRHPISPDTDNWGPDDLAEDESVLGGGGGVRFLPDGTVSVPFSVVNTKSYQRRESARIYPSKQAYSDAYDQHMSISKNRTTDYKAAREMATTYEDSNLTLNKLDKLLREKGYKCKKTIIDNGVEMACNECEVLLTEFEDGLYFENTKLLQVNIKKLMQGPSVTIDDSGTPPILNLGLNEAELIEVQPFVFMTIMLGSR